MALVQLDLVSGRGDQLLTFDSSTGLEWLNLTATSNLSYLDVLGGAGGFIGSFGFRHATSAEVTKLYKNAGVSKLAGPTAAVDMANHFGIMVLQNLMNGKAMGPLASPASTSVDSKGMVRYSGAGMPAGTSPIEIRQTHINMFEPDKSYTDAGSMTQRAGLRSPFVGSYLIRKRFS